MGPVGWRFKNTFRVARENYSEMNWWVLEEWEVVQRYPCRESVCADLRGWNEHECNIIWTRSKMHKDLEMGVYINNSGRIPVTGNVCAGNASLCA
jgi:hypothetical protein